MEVAAHQVAGRAAASEDLAEAARAASADLAAAEILGAAAQAAVGEAVRQDMTRLSYSEAKEALWVKPV